MKGKKEILKWVEKTINDKKLKKAQYFYGNYEKSKRTITIEEGYKPQF